jgi:hypothetical protein
VGATGEEHQVAPVVGLVAHRVLPVMSCHEVLVSADAVGVGGRTWEGYPAGGHARAFGHGKTTCRR